MNLTRFIVYISFSIYLLLGGCTGNNQSIQENNSENNVSITKISSNKKTDQKVSNDIKEMLMDHDDIYALHIVNSKKDVIIAVNISNFDRFRLDDIKKNVQKKVKKEFPNKKVFVSTDQKIILEVEKLENKLQSSSMTEKELKKKMNKIIDLDKEET